MNERIERLNTMINEGRIIRNAWTDGQERACLLAALSPEAGEAEDAAACPASVMPAWLAHLTPWMDDAGSEAEWPRFVRRYAACAVRWSVLDEAAWRRCEVAATRAAVIEAMQHTTGADVLASCEHVLAWLDAGAPEAEREAVAAGAAWAARAAAKATRAADAAARAAAGGAARTAAPRSESVAARMASWAASRRAASRAAAWAADAAADAAATADAVATADAATWASAAAHPWAAVAAADRITNAVLTALEDECGLSPKV